MGVHEVLGSIGGFGRYQWIHFILVSFTFKLSQHFQTLGIIFTGFNNPHHCKVPSNTTAEAVIPTIIGPDGDPLSAHCHRYSIPGDNSSELSQCYEGWDYDAGLFHPSHGTIVMQWDLVCDQKDALLVAITILNMGVVVGAFFASFLGDIFGRKPVFIGCMTSVGVLGIVNAVVPDFTSFCVVSFLRGMATVGVMNQGLIILGELIPRHLAMLLFPVSGVMDSLGQCLVSLFSLAFTQWRHLQIVLSSASILFIAYAAFCPESLSWLAGKGRTKEALRQLETIARVNGKKFDKLSAKELLLRTNNENKPKQSTNEVFRKFFSSPKAVLYLFIISFINFVHYMLHYGQSLLQGSLAGDIHVNFIINALLILPGQLLGLPAMAIFGRKYSFIFIFNILQGLCLAMAGAVKFIPLPDGWNEDIIVTVLTLVTRLWVAGVTPVISLYSQELFPTPIRSTLMGIFSGSGSLGTVVAPFISLSLVRIKYWIPGAIFGVISLLAAILVMLLPETTGRGMPETVEEVISMPRSLTQEENDALRMNTPCCPKVNNVRDDGGEVDKLGERIKSEIQAEENSPLLSSDNSGIQAYTN